MIQENIPLQPNEEIKPIIGYEGLYSITSFGRVWSHLRHKGTRWYGGYFLKSYIERGGYFQSHLCKNSKSNYISTHRLVAQAFIPNSLSLLQVNHKDGNKQNNYAGTKEKNYKDGNLEWCTSQENHNHALINGLRRKATSKYYGVYFHKNLIFMKKWITQVTANHKRVRVGNFLTELEAAKAYNDYIIRNKLDRPLNILE